MALHRDAVTWQGQEWSQARPTTRLSAELRCFRTGFAGLHRG